MFEVVNVFIQMSTLWKGPNANKLPALLLKDQVI